MIIKDNNPYKEASFSLGNRIARAVWGIVWIFLFRPSPRPMHAWRNLLLKIFGAKLGVHNHIYPSAKIWAPWNLICDDFVGIADGVTVYNMAPITIGKYCVVSQGAHLCAGSHDYNSTNFQLITAPIVLQDRVWVCAEAFIHMGVILPEGAVIGARAVVTKSLAESWTVYTGIPAVAVAKRNKVNN